MGPVLQLCVIVGEVVRDSSRNDVHSGMTSTYESTTSEVLRGITCPEAIKNGIKIIIIDV